MALRLVSALRVRAVPAAPTVLKASVAHGHGLVVPPEHIHIGVTPFENGVPAKQVRDLSPAEKKWDFWTSSDAFTGAKPETGLKAVPFGQAWVIERGGSAKVVSSGSALILPGLDKVKAVKNTHPVAMGVVTPAVASNAGTVNAYAVVYVKITDFVKSAYYVDPETNRPDSERAAAKLVRKVLEQQVAAGADKSKVEDAVKSALAARATEYGLEVVNVEFRGVFDASANVPDKLRALDPPQRAADAPGHGLSADYWSEVLSPPFFEKKKFGSRKEPKTPATVTLEWVIPSPPDYHHFNEIPKLTTAPPAAAKAVAKH